MSDAETQDFKVNCRSPQAAGWRPLNLSLSHENLLAGDQPGSNLRVERPVF
jgi:hypothetical protein